MENFTEQQAFKLMMGMWEKADTLPNIFVAGIWAGKQIDAIKNNSPLPNINNFVCPVCGVEHNGDNKHCNDCINKYYDSIGK